jgi:omega-amidase
MAKILKVAILQYDVLWHRIEDNLRKAGDLIAELTHSVDLILLPEMFATGFTMKPDLITKEEHALVAVWFQDISIRYNVAIAGTHPTGDNNRFSNRLMFYSGQGKKMEYYDKRHLFSIGEEDKRYTSGSDRKIVDFSHWKLMPLICYDLRFPVWSRNDMDYDVLLYLSNWPASRNEVWNILLRARAIENQCFVIGVNRIGIDGRKIKYIGNSQVISPKGTIMAALNGEEETLYVELDRDELAGFRSTFPVLKDRDRFEIK